MGYFLSRQRDAKDNCLYVEIASGGPKKAGPDILTSRYNGEGKNLVDPRDAVNIAERIYKSWDRDYWDEKKRLRIISGDSIGIFDFTPKDITAAKVWAEKVFAQMSKCGSCAKPIGASKDPIEIDEISNAIFCNAHCAARKYRDMYGKEIPDDRLKQGSSKKIKSKLFP